MYSGDLGSYLGRNTGYPEVSCGFLQGNTRIIPRLGQDQFLPNPFQFIFNLSSYHSTLLSLGDGRKIGHEKDTVSHKHPT